MGTLHQRHKGFSFHGLTQDVTVFVKISTFFHNFLSFLYSSSSAYIKFSLVFFAIWPFCSEGVQSHSSTTPVVKWITLVFEVNPLKIVEGDIASILPPFSVAPRPIWSNLELEKRGETVWRWGDAYNVAPHLMCLKCLWPVRLALWSAANLMVSQVQGDAVQTDRAGKKTQKEVLWSLKRPE